MGLWQCGSWNSYSRPLFARKNVVLPVGFLESSSDRPFGLNADFEVQLFVFRLFGTKCPKCQLTIGEQDYVMRAGQQAYHTDCFSCSVCNRRLTKGDMYYLTNSGSILCKADRDAGRQLTLQHQQKPMPAGSSSRKQTAGGTLISTQDSMTLKGGSASGSGSSTSSTPDSTIPPVSTEPTSKTGSLGEPAGSTDKSHTKTSEYTKYTYNSMHTDTLNHLVARTHALDIRQ